MHENTYNNKKNKNDKYSNETKNIHTNYNKTTSAARVTTWRAISTPVGATTETTETTTETTKQQQQQQHEDHYQPQQQQQRQKQLQKQEQQEQKQQQQLKFEGLKMTQWSRNK